MTLNGIWPLFYVITTLTALYFKAKCVNLVEDRSILFATKNSPKNLAFGIYDLCRYSQRLREKTRCIK